jgi:hypothetical protein
MRVIVALVVVGMSFTLSGCACPPQTGHAKFVRSKCALRQSQPRVPKFTRASAAKTVTKASRPVSKRSKKIQSSWLSQCVLKSKFQHQPIQHQPILSHRCRQGSLNWLTSNLQQPMRRQRRPCRQGSRNKHPRVRPTPVNTLSSLTASSWPPKKRHSAREFNRLQARTFAA